MSLAVEKASSERRYRSCSGPDSNFKTWLAYKRYLKINELSDEVLEERLRNIKGMVEHWDWQIHRLSALSDAEKQRFNVEKQLEKAKSAINTAVKIRLG